MSNPANKKIIAFIFLFTSVLAFGCGPEKPDNCLNIHELQTTEVQPAGVRSVFQLLDCDGYPISDLKDSQVEIRLDGEKIQTEGSVGSILTQQVNFENYSLLLLDMSNSIVENGNLAPMVNAARNLVQKLATQNQHVAIYQFAGPAYFGEVQGFTTDQTLLNAALDELLLSTGLGTTDLYGSIPKAVNALLAAGDPEILNTKTMVIFTDGTDEAMAASQSSAQKAIDNSGANVFTVGLGGDVDKEELISFGKDGFEWAENADKLNEAFDAVIQGIFDLANSYYLVALCSPRVGGWREMSVLVERDGKAGRLDVTYDATGFDIVGCNVHEVAFPCEGLECGDISGISCGECGGTEYCTEYNMCEEACTEEIECGLNLGVDCGDCSELGETFACEENKCVDVCKEVQCGTILGIDCGDCSELGETFACDEDHTCVDACADAECGVLMGVDCGSCDFLGETFACDENYTCVDACADAECGTVLGVDCGDCSELGEDFGCDENHTCVDACADAECGTVLGVDCGDCSEFGEDFGCDENHTCVNACIGAECGTILGVNCGDCSELGSEFVCDDDNQCVDPCVEVECGEIMGVECGECSSGFDCNADNVCIPVSLPGMSWSKVTASDLTLGCDTGLDPSCSLDEVRREVSLSSFWIMDTEVTVSMFETCIDEGGCNASNVDTGEGCNFGAYAEDRQNHPANCVSWNGLKQFCAYVGGRLPTEAEWERALRGDHDDVIAAYWIYPWGNTPAPSCTQVVMNEGGLGCGLEHTNEVGTKPSTSFGLNNMGGNVSEWVGDYYSETFEDCDGGPCEDPTGPTSGSDRVVRGGAWDDMYATAFRTAARDKEDQSTMSPTIGGRCVK